MDNCLSVAQTYARRGWSVIPLKPRSKIPACPWDKFQRGRASEEAIANWWARRPDDNIGIVCGQVSGLIVVDIDGVEGLAEWQSYTVKHGEEPTLTAETGGGGLHLFFQSVDECGIHIGNATPFKHIHIRGNGGYVVAAPSLHPSGRRYVWREGTREPATVPIWLLELLVVGHEPDVASAEQVVEPAHTNATRPTQAQGSVSGILRKLAIAQEGNRNALLYWCANRLRDRGIPHCDSEAMLTPIAEACGLPTSETLKTIGSAYRGGAR